MGFHAIFYDWCMVHGHSDLLSRLVCAPADKMRGVYLHANMLELEVRRPMMEVWAAECATVRGVARDLPNAGLPAIPPLRLEADYGWEQRTGLGTSG